MTPDETVHWKQIIDLFVKGEKMHHVTSAELWNEEGQTMESRLVEQGWVVTPLPYSSFWMCMRGDSSAFVLLFSFFFVPAVSSVDVNPASGRLLLFWAPWSRIIPGFRHANVYFCSPVWDSRRKSQMSNSFAFHECTTQKQCGRKKMRLNISAFIYLVRFHL